MDVCSVSQELTCNGSPTVHLVRSDDDHDDDTKSIARWCPNRCYIWNIRSCITTRCSWYESLEFHRIIALHRIGCLLRQLIHLTGFVRFRFCGSYKMYGSLRKFLWQSSLAFSDGWCAMSRERSWQQSFPSTHINKLIHIYHHAQAKTIHLHIDSHLSRQHYIGLFSQSRTQGSTSNCQ